MNRTTASIILTSIFLFTFSYLSPVHAQTTWTCASCYDCSEYLQNGSLSSEDILTLTADITGHSGTCISFGGADDITFDCDGFTISGNGSTSTGRGIWLNGSGSGSRSNIITGCTNISYFYTGLCLIHTSHNNTLTNITASNNRYGLSIYYTDNNTLTNITVSNNQDKGIYLSSSDNNTLTNIAASNNTEHALYIWHSRNNTITDITITTEGNQGGFYAEGEPSYQNNITNAVTVNGKPVQYFDGYYKPCPNNQILDYNDTYSQVTFVTCNNITLKNTTATDSVYLFHTNNTKIYNVNSSYNYYGLRIWGSDNNTLINITASGNQDTGLTLYQSSNTILTSITASSNQDTGLSLSSSDNNILTSITASDNNIGLSIFSYHNNTIANVTANNNNYGLYSYDSSNNTFTNIAASSNKYSGFLSLHVNSNTLANIIANNNNNGIWLYSSDNNTITNVTANNNDYGIYLIRDSEYNIFNDSRIENNTKAGVNLTSSDSEYPTYNIFYNNYLNNTVNIYSDNDLNQNYWNVTKDCSSGTNIIGGPCMGGNYWTDSDGGNFSDTCMDSDGDGICDSSYTPSLGNTDYFPLYWDMTAPHMDFVDPTPDDDKAFPEQDWIYVNVSSNEPLDICILDWNGINETFSPDGTLCSINKTDLDNGEFTYLVYANDSSGNMNATETRTVSIEMPDIPVIEKYEIIPYPLVPFGKSIRIGVNASDYNGIDYVWANITDPNNQYHHVPLANNEFVSWGGPGKTNILGIYNITIFANDTLSNVVNKTDNFTVTDLPIIENYEILPLLVPFGQPVLIGVNASDDKGIDEVWANITDPSGTHHHAVLLNNQLVPWSTGAVGTYDITIFAEDTSFNIVNVTGSFYVNTLVSADITVLDASDTGVSAGLDIYLPGTEQAVFTCHDSDGEFNASVVEHEYDMLFRVFDDQLELLLTWVPLASGFNGTMGLDKPNATDGFEHIFAVDTDYVMDGAVITIYYDDMGFDNESNINAYLCDDWDFPGQACDDEWELIESATRDEDNGFLEFPVQGFSAFALKQDSWCGDGWCGPRETVSSCPEDCQCNDGDTRPCSEARKGRCAEGTETCSNNVWSGCPQPLSESCNTIDDDCDGIIDNVDGGSSMAATRCQCYGGATPQLETCNGIDDDCDGLIDNDADCCTIGQTRQCGPGTDDGECVFGNSACSGGVWGTCTGAVYPRLEVCGDGLDNDCDGETDENCRASPCGEGEITQGCLCEGSARTWGYCCSGIYSEKECVDNPWWILIAIGVAILAVLAVLIVYFKSKGRELTWEELMKRYTPATS